MFADLKPTDVLAAADRIRPLIKRTALVQSRALSAAAGGAVYLKLENEQTTGSFKLRGALNVLATLTPEQRKRGVVASSAGNHGLGVAYAAKHFGVPATASVDVVGTGSIAAGQRPSSFHLSRQEIAGTATYKGSLPSFYIDGQGVHEVER